MTLAVYITVVTFLLGVAQARLVFPPGSDMGYIVSDDPETKFDEANGIDELVDDNYEKHLLQRAEREAIDAVESALLRRIQDRIRIAKDVEDEYPQTTVKDANRMAAVPDNLPENMKDDKHGVAMGVPHIKCDNGKVNLSVDWNESPVNYTCYDPKHHRLPVQEDLKSVTQCVNIPPNYVPQHYCMGTEISYNSSLPVYGPHRPLWPTYGEYTFVPPQRWLHTVEHGGVVMLYHPCAEPLLVQRLKKVLTGCFRKHVITPYSNLTVERPLALVAWGCSIEMAVVDEKEVKAFIKKRALHGPEGHMAKDGSFNQYLIAKAEYPPGSDNSDKNICPMDKD
ncbi:uncharacterized protein [Palaemon carinicauda]|uniref:uncharacterized protein isoform X2 n=1 Tax=Palaemon carinicauda TaxID=392227 RepID=UPI0035B604DA